MAKLIMVADDSEEILDLYHNILTDEGYGVSLLSSHTNVFEQASRLKPALIILDLLFSEQLVGWEVVKQLKVKDAPTATIPIIVSSVKRKFGEDEETELLGENLVFLPKPFNLEELLEMIEGLIGKP